MPARELRVSSYKTARASAKTEVEQKRKKEGRRIGEGERASDGLSELECSLRRKLL